ncbi:hypothetical protein L6452_05225 [Arctium lappa]|uniref:Uncharacterized protein n=1 Tax=Arctium lappa TaxID=4217 RepID=A0ACB9EFT9_ARCLA|nr:hypothetical protein L6452_05225 [Arctium lappa]
MKLVDLQSAVMKKYKCLVSINQCARARTQSISEFEQGMKKHYDKLWDYGEEVRRTNPRSTLKMSVEANPDGKTYFQGFYICLQGLKEGWISGCRRVIGLDGFFLKTICKGVLLSAVGRDGKNQIFPIAWVVVNIENKENWTWFIDLLKEDLSLNDGVGTTLISDQHKVHFHAFFASL